MNIKIEHNIPIPKERQKYPFKDMEVGDSFLVKIGQGNVHNASYIYGRKHNKQFTSRKEGKHIRIWRIK